VTLPDPYHHEIVEYVATGDIDTNLYSHKRNIVLNRIIPFKLVGKIESPIYTKRKVATG